MNRRQLQALPAGIAARRLLQYPRVVGVGFGYKEIRGELTGTPALRVYVREKVPGSELRRAEIVPREIGGIPTDILPALTGAPISGDGIRGPVAAGMAVSNLKGVLDQAAAAGGASGFGTLGFLAAVNGTTRLEVVLVSNRHVLLAHGARKGDPVYQPVYAREDGMYIFRRDSLEPIAEILDEGLEANYTYSYPGEPAKEYFLDCATARLFMERGIRIQPALTFPEGTALLAGAARVHELDVLAGRELRVSKLGAAGGRSFGRVVDVAAPVVTSGQGRRLNNLLIRAEAGDGAASFAEDGDSGAVIVDEHNRAVGLLWGKSRENPAEAFACHIHPLLQRLHVTPLTYDPSLLSCQWSVVSSQ